MSDNNAKFHQFALQSMLFKGRPDWYFCYLKAGKLAEVLSLLAHRSHAQGQSDLTEVAKRCGYLSGEIAHLAAGEIDLSVVLADVFALLNTVQLLSTQEYIHVESAAILRGELEHIAQRLVRGSNPSPFIASPDLEVPLLEQASPMLAAPYPSMKDIKSKGQNTPTKGQSERTSLILELVRKRKSLSIKEIAAEIKGCSEKTIQRELSELIRQGLIKKVGERRWSLYLPA